MPALAASSNQSQLRALVTKAGGAAEAFKQLQNQTGLQDEVLFDLQQADVDISQFSSMVRMLASAVLGNQMQRHLGAYPAEDVPDLI